jgi:hypothetical protein
MAVQGIYTCLFFLETLNIGRQYFLYIHNLYSVLFNLVHFKYSLQFHISVVTLHTKNILQINSLVKKHVLWQYTCNISWKTIMDPLTYSGGLM